MRVLHLLLITASSLVVACGAANKEPATPAPASVDSTTAPTATTNPSSASSAPVASTGPAAGKDITSSSNDASGDVTPEAACDHMLVVLQSDMKKSGVNMAAKEVREVRKKCVEEGQHDRKADPKKWACESPCIMKAQTLDGLSACEDACK